MRNLAALCLALLGASLASTAPLHGQAIDCSDGGAGTAIFDDGTFESAITWGPGTAPLVTWAMRVDPPFPASRLEEVCICWTILTYPADDEVSFDVAVWDAMGPGGAPGNLIGKLRQVATGVPALPASQFYRYDLASLGIRTTGPLYIGPAWDPTEDQFFYACIDTSPATARQPVYYGADLYARPPVSPATPAIYPELQALGIRAIFTPSPLPPPTPPLVTPSLPGFQFWVRIGGNRAGTAAKTPCPAETLCVAGAIPTRAEVFVRIVGPKPNGYLWPNIVKFNTTATEVWILQVATGDLQYYALPALDPETDTLPGLVDRTGFLP